MGIASLTLLSAFSHPLHALARWLQPAMHGGRDAAAARPRSCKVPLPASTAPAWPAARVPLHDIAPPAAEDGPLDAMPSAAPGRGTAAQTSKGHATGTRHLQQARCVVRVLRTAASGADAGRLVISGRMADVCAELDRMAAREALQH